MEFLKPFASQERGHPGGSNMAVLQHSSQDSGGPLAEETPWGSGPRLKVGKPTNVPLSNSESR